MGSTGLYSRQKQLLIYMCVVNQQREQFASNTQHEIAM